MGMKKCAGCFKWPGREEALVFNLIGNGESRRPTLHETIERRNVGDCM
jgi:hypothetical protein